MWQSLLDNPWPIGFALAVAGAIMVLHFKRPRKPVGMTVGALLLLAAVGVFALSFTVTTPRRTIIEQTKQAIAATAPLDTAALRGLLEPTVILAGPSGAIWREGRPLLDEIEGAIGRIDIREHNVRELVAQVEGPTTAVSFIDLRTTLTGGGMGGQPIRSKWRLTWRRGDDGHWRISEIQWVELQGTPPTNDMWR